MKVKLVGLSVTLALVLCAACGDDPQPTPAAQATTEPATPTVMFVPPTTTPTATPVPSPTATATAIPRPAAVQRVVPSIVKIRIRDADVGSGFVVEGGYIVTAAHVVRRHTVIDVVFENGVEHKDVPVGSYDHLADLAFLGPIDTSAPHVEFANVDNEIEGSSVFVVGYPSGYAGLFASTGYLQRVYYWRDTDLADVFSMAEGKPGMSGGPVVNGNGEVIAVVLQYYNDRSSSGISSNVVMDRLERIARGEEISPAGPRPLPQDQGSYEHEFVLRGRADTETFFLPDLSEASITIDFDTAPGVDYGLFHETGYTDFSPAFRSTRSGLQNSCCYYGTWFVVVRQRYDLEGEVVIKSSVPLVQYHDPDDGRQLQIGHTIYAMLDTWRDSDRYTIDLKRGQMVGLRTESVEEARMTISYPGAAPHEIVSAFGKLGEIHYQASVDAEYTIAIESKGGIGGYTLSAFDIPSNLTPSNKSKKPADTIESPVGDMLRHSFGNSPSAVQIEYPLNVTGGDHAEILGAALFEQGLRGQTVALGKRDMKHLRRDPNENIPVGLFVLRSALVHNLPLRSARVTTSREMVTPSGAPILIQDFEADDGHTKGVRLAYIHEGETGFMVVFYAPADVFDEWKPVVDYCIGSFSIGDFSVADGM